MEGEKTVLITLAKETMGHKSFERLFEADYVDMAITHWVSRKHPEFWIIQNSTTCMQFDAPCRLLDSNFFYFELLY